ncbi:MAG: hypothetical protein IRZ01_00230 [Thermoflavifilum aggregans]|nr:hypothetical protein [Thermoflavifilum aggregans]
MRIAPVKIIRLSPDMTVSALKEQMQQLLGCDTEVYYRHEPAPPDFTLQQIGFHLPADSPPVLQMPIDETWRIRDLEMWFEQECQLQVELALRLPFPFKNKYIRLYQLRGTR